MSKLFVKAGHFYSFFYIYPKREKTLDITHHFFCICPKREKTLDITHHFFCICPKREKTGHYSPFLIT
jgi:hypothetical protein